MIALLNDWGGAREEGIARISSSSLVICCPGMTTSPTKRRVMLILTFVAGEDFCSALAAVSAGAARGDGEDDTASLEREIDASASVAAFFIVEVSG